jgi:carboxyl-terminal processing protease
MFQKTPVINDRLLASLNKSYLERLKSDIVLARFADDTEQARKSMNDTRISLNETVRKKEMEEAEKKAAARKLNTKLVNKEAPRTSDLHNVEDDYLREGLFVLGDLITSKIG